MQFDSYCVECMLGREAKLARSRLSPKDTFTYLKEVMQIMVDAPAGLAAPYLIPLLSNAIAKYGVTGDLYGTLKKDSNDYVLALLPKIRKIVAVAEDSVKMALKFARTGNFLDFGVLSKDEVDRQIEDAIEATPASELDDAEYGALCRDLENAKQLLIIGDNAGEIVFDTLLVEHLKLKYPKLRIVYGVRGGNCLNDATREDASYVGMDKLCPVVDNGTRISGTELTLIGDEMRRAIAESDVILSKGQANFETMAGCGYNIYYIFLCKCDRLSRILGCPILSGVFRSEKRMKAVTPFPK